MIGNFILIYVEIAYAVLQHPGELPVYLRRIPRLKAYIAITLLLSSLSSAIGVYVLRDYYDISYRSVLPALLILHFLAFLTWGLLFGSITDSLLGLNRSTEGMGQSWQMISISIFSIMPGFFILPAAFIVSFFSKRFAMEPFIFMVPIIAFLTCWSIYIVISGIGSLYGISTSSAFRSYLKSQLILLGFPVICALLAMAVMTQFFA